MSDKQTPNLPSGTEIKRCWNRCVQEEQRVLATDLKDLQGQFEDDLIFGPIPITGTSDLARMLRSATANDQKWQILAMWLKQERVWRPEEFLPTDVRKRLIVSTLAILEKGPTSGGPNRRTRHLTVKPSELRYALVAEGWKQYFELMRVANDHLPNQRHLSLQVALTKLGFSVDAVDAALHSTNGLGSPVDAACRFASTRLKVGDDTVLVAHSKIYPVKRCTT